LSRFVARHGEAALGALAADALPRRWPQFSAAPRRFRFPYALAIVAAALVSTGYVFPVATRMAVEIGLALCFLSWLALRLIGSCLTPPRVRPARRDDRELPVYTIIVALYREAAAVEDLVAALRALAYPPEKLDIKLVVEADDIETGLALLRLELGPPFEIITAPAAGPRTKPKALNAALALARGTFTAVYDAEDRPDPDQLRRALDVFLSRDDTLACVQASLTIDNTDDSWLARLFTAEYAAQFDLVLPGLAALELPLPLGGSSNHFRTAALRKVGAWDSYNVTEDADLGMRLARCGYRSTTVRSSTYEEAPLHCGPWLRQRTRWFKGWLQTWLVHMRSPRRLMADLGVAGFLSFQLVVGGSVLAALIHPLVLAGFLYAYLNDLSLFGRDGPLVTTLAWIYGGALAAGYLTSIFLGLRGLQRRGLMRVGWCLVAVPLHWLLLSAAAWRALYQMLRDPQRWEKTEHGLARSSRRAKQASRTALGAVLGGDREFRREAAE
jgi:glycosyltransferase XagB